MDEMKIFEKAKLNKNVLFNYIKQKQKTSKTIGPFIKDKVILSEHPSEILRKQYESVFSKPKGEFKISNPYEFFNTCILCQKEIVHICPDDMDGPRMGSIRELSNIYFSEDDTRESISKIEANMSCGPDGIPGILLRKCIDTLAGPLTKFWNLSSETGKIPARLKKAFILPTLKPGSSKNDPASFRPISQTSQLMKVHERSVKRFLQSHLEVNGYLNSFQYGFREKRSCLAQLLVFYDNILSNIEKGVNQDCIYLDFSKAFDVVDWGILCHRMRKKGIIGNMGLWLYDFLQERTQQVLVNNVLSSTSKVTSGVPQGTVLGPLMFLILIDSLGDTEMDAIIKAFADDSKVTLPVNNTDQAAKLQENMELIYNWESDNNMRFNISKFNVIKFGRNSEMKEEYNYFGPETSNIMIDNDEVRDLGVIITPDCDYKSHISKVISKINQRVGYILRTFKNRNLDFMKWAWKVYVQPLADYCSQLWGPSNGPELKRIENTLKSFSSKILCIKHMSYWDRLKAMKLYSMGRRIERYKILYIFKIITGQVQNCGVKWSNNENSGTIFTEISTQIILNHKGRIPSILPHQDFSINCHEVSEMTDHPH